MTEDEQRQQLASFLMGEKDRRQASETLEKGMLWPVVKSGYTGKPEWSTEGGIIGSAIDAFTLPGRVYNGEVAPDDPGEMLNFVGNVAGGGMAASMPRPSAGVAGMFGGVRAKTADHGALAKAQAAEAAGVPREQIWQDHGWFKGPDQKWRFEIDDSLGYFLNDRRSGRLSSVYDHQDLYAAYSDVKRAQLTRYGPEDDGSRGSYRSDIPLGDLELISLNRAFDQEPTLAHELQHGLQYREGFESGGSPRQFTPEQIAAERARLSGQSDGGRTSVGTYDPSLPDRQIAEGLYNRLAGEVEARAVSKRINLDAEQRRSRAPWLDYDVPEAQQIVRFGNDEAQKRELARMLMSGGQ